MFQCLGLGTQETGGCGEDWYHPGCLVGMGPKWFEKMKPSMRKSSSNGVEGSTLATISEGNEDKPDIAANDADAAVVDEDDEPPLPPGFPEEDDFEGFLCYKCVESNPWIKCYAGTSGFLPAVYLAQPDPENGSNPVVQEEPSSKKRKAEDDTENTVNFKRVKNETGEAADAEAVEAKPNVAVTAGTGSESATAANQDILGCKLPNLPPSPAGRFSLFFKDGFRDKLCRCTSCYRKMTAHPQLLEEEEVYEPPISEDGASQHGGSTHGSGQSPREGGKRPPQRGPRASHRGRHGVQPPQGAAEAFFSAICGKWQSGWRRGHQGVFCQAARR